MPYSQTDSLKQGRDPVIDGPLVPLGYIQVTNLAAAVGLGTIPAGARVALLYSEGAALRWRDDGTNPTASVGMPLDVSTPLRYSGDLSKIKLIAQTGAPVLNIAFYG